MLADEEKTRKKKKQKQIFAIFVIFRSRLLKILLIRKKQEIEVKVSVYLSPFPDLRTVSSSSNEVNLPC